MNKFIRKVTKAKWNNQLSEDSNLNSIISADAITGCLRTKSNTLSIWNVDDVDDAILALASVNDSIVPIDYIVIDDEFFHKTGVTIKNVIAESNPVESLREKHFDIINLDYNSLGLISKEIANGIILEKNKYISRCNATNVKKILKDAISTKRIKLEELNSNLQSKLLPIA